MKRTLTGRLRKREASQARGRNALRRTRHRAKWARRAHAIGRLVLRRRTKGTARTARTAPLQREHIRSRSVAVEGQVKVPT